MFQFFLRIYELHEIYEMCQAALTFPHIYVYIYIGKCQSSLTHENLIYSLKCPNNAKPKCVPETKMSFYPHIVH